MKSRRFRKNIEEAFGPLTPRRCHVEKIAFRSLKNEILQQINQKLIEHLLISRCLFTCFLKLLKDPMIF